MKINPWGGTVKAVLLLAVVLAAVGQLPSSAQAPADVVQIRGAGATFPAPLYQKWIDEYQKENAGVKITYAAVGSGEGIKRFVAGTVDFGASDAALGDGEATQMERGARLVPATAGMVVLAYNVPEVKGELKFKRDVLVDIFSGRIRNWNDPRIKATNPDMALPNKTIAVVVRQESSGTTYAFTNHLSAISEEWRDRGPGVGKVIDWPGAAMRAVGNEGVAGRIKISDGAIGYVEYGFAKRLGLPMAWLENKTGQFVKPDAQSGERALLNGSVEIPQNLRIFIPDPPGNDAYPIVTYTWLLLYDHYPNAKTMNAVKGFVNWGLNQGQQLGVDMGYLRLPKDIVLRGLEVVARVHQ